MLSNYDFSGSGLTFSKSGNSLTITAEKAPKDDVLITVNKKNSQRKAVITWTDEKIGPQSGQLQDIVTFGQSVSDPVKAYLNVKVSLGNAKLMKVSEDGKVDNVKFHISGNGISKDVTTNANGEIQIDNLPPGNYQISEYTDVKYVPQDTQAVTIVSGQTASVQFSNVLKKFRVNVTKQDYEKDTHKVTLNSVVLFMVCIKAMNLLHNIQPTVTALLQQTIMYVVLIGQ